ncbi:probable polypeptide N-acetylgalactosaminyltransferase 8 isoform X3 [Moschus berezovskii]|uniref:probable polypeptide N-acetylgalactosaminyltransferase 8 isoform X3 n=1 Tax=Moschus berezovskii TaxID=68408 RepID=UPI0024451523|nr:probable polypeptide N-acetylgalactosaminyltransferase 8 isoform X3 [Moschus berezovskii]
MLRRNVLRVLSIGLPLVFAFNLLLIFYTKRIVQELILGDRQNKLQFAPSELNWTVMDRLSQLEANLQHLKQTMKLATKQSEDGVGTLATVKDEKHPFPDTAHAKEGDFFKENPHKVLFPDSELFRKWGRDLSEAQQKEAEDLFQKFGYNVYLSDRLPLNRTIPDTRDSRCHWKRYPSQLPSLSVILIFVDEALSVIQRAITSIIQRTPPQLLKEVILVDDFSSNGELKADLDEKIKLYNQKSPGLLKIIRHTERRGLAAARNTGREAATADVVAILDAHVEVNVGWAEPILARIQEDRTVIVSPVFDNILFDTFELIKYALAVDGFDWELWCRYDALPKDWIDLHDVTAPVRSPSIMGILAANRLFLEEIGSLDAGMLTYGGENVELSLRVWQCGGRIEVLPCSRVAHLERHHKPYSLDLTIPMKRNALRVAEIWMDEYKDMVYMAWNIPLQMKNTLDERVCLDQGAVPGNTPIMHHCHQYSPQNVYYHLTGEFYVGPLIAQRDADDRCLTDPGKGEKPTLEPCSKAVKDRLNIHWDFKPGRAVINRVTKRCLEMKKDVWGGYTLVLQACTAQVWTIQYTVRNWGSD